MMEFINDFTKLPSYPRNVIKMATQALAPFAPHLAEEIWERLGCKEPLLYAPFPVPDEKYLQDENITLVVQINGKLRGRLELEKGSTPRGCSRSCSSKFTCSRVSRGKTDCQSDFCPQ